MKFASEILLITLLLFAPSCKDPFDIITPKTITPIHGTNYLHLKEMLVEEDGQAKIYEVKDIFVEIDTAKVPERIWFKLNIASKEKYDPFNSKFFIDSIFILFDSVAVENSFQAINSRPGSSPLVSYNLRRGMGIISDTLVYSQENYNIGRIKFSYNYSKKEVLAEMLTKINDRKIWLEDRDTFIVNEIRFVKGDSVWFEYDTVKASTKLEVSRPDSIEIRAFFRFLYD